MNKLLARLCKKWELTDLISVGTDTSSTNYVVRAYSALYKVPVVLKILQEKTHELEALKIYNGKSCVKLLDFIDNGTQQKILLLEYIQPGNSLNSLFPIQDELACLFVADIVEDLQEVSAKAPLTAFDTVSGLLALLHTHTSTHIPEDLLQKARDLSKKLVNNKQHWHFLHGDLHGNNILLRDDTWVAIDPKGVVGPIEYEIGRFIMNPIPQLLEKPEPESIIKKRIKFFSERLKLNGQNIIDWAFVQAVLSACWTEEDGSPVFFKHFVSFAEIINRS